LAAILGPLVGRTHHHIKNSGDFINKIKDLEVPPGRKMVSFDVTALFTSIPVPDAIKAVEEHMKRDKTWTQKTNLNKIKRTSLNYSTSASVQHTLSTKVNSTSKLREQQWDLQYRQSLQTYTWRNLNNRH
jgi:ABC-type transporter Mla maintaining outer membrane lipid asymmetry ATPase subunit MlaF